MENTLPSVISVKSHIWNPLCIGKFGKRSQLCWQIILTRDVLNADPSVMLVVEGNGREEGAVPVITVTCM